MIFNDDMDKDRFLKIMEKTKEETNYVYVQYHEEFYRNVSMKFPFWGLDILDYIA
ncbi:MAG: hypothetical protein K0S30_1568 [Clostridia bacterium]|nr:hypothetical protein [Clostridia bacterium]